MGFTDAQTDAPAVMDCRAVMQAASLLKICEFDFFRLAFRRWSGREAEEKFLERTFADYMFHQTVPTFVRHLSREIIRLKEQGALDVRAFGAEFYRKRHPLPSLGKLSMALVAVAMVVLFIFFSASTPILETRPVPGCPGATGSKFFEDWVYTISGKQPPPCDAFRKLR